jgi:L-malate glycosyltransferase
MRFSGYIIKRKIENIFIFPFVLLGRILAKFDPLPKQYNIFFFFPFYHTGGAEKGHALIAKAAGNESCIIFFTRKSLDNRFSQEFSASGCEIRDISKYTDNKWLYFLNLVWRGKITGYINNQTKKPVVFNGQSNFGYKISPWVAQSIKQVELIHSFNTFSWIRVPFLPFINQTVMISKLRIEEHLQQYKKIDIPVEYGNRISFIQNAIELPGDHCNKSFNTGIKVLFVGRGTSEKRPEIFASIAKELPQLQFTLVGDMPGNILASLSFNITALGNVNSVDDLHNIYCEHHILIIPSSTEGFPIVLMEAMARGCAVMATPVGDIPYHINENNGYLFSSIEPAIVITEAKAWLEDITVEQLQSMSETAREYAFKNFSIDLFNQQYKAILQP